MSIHLFIYWSV